MVEEAMDFQLVGDFWNSHESCRSVLARTPLLRSYVGEQGSCMQFFHVHLPRVRRRKSQPRKHVEILSPNVYQREERLEQITYLRTSGETETKYSNVKTGYFHTQQGLCCQRGLAGHFFSTCGMLMLDFLEFIHDQGMRQFLLEDGISSNFIKSILRQARRRSWRAEKHENYHATPVQDHRISAKCTRITTKNAHRRSWTAGNYENYRAIRSATPDLTPLLLRLPSTVRTPSLKQTFGGNMA